MKDDKSVYAEQIKYLTDLGPRTSGSDAHRALIEQVADDFAVLGYDVHRDTHTFERWDAGLDKIALSVCQEQVALSSAWPYSAETPVGGITAPLTLIRGASKNWKEAAGKIALIEVHNKAVPTSLLVDTWDGVYPSEEMRSPVLGQVFANIDLTEAKNAGVLGVVAVWVGITDEAARGQYVPFTNGYQGLPAVWAPASAHESLTVAAQRGDEATLMLAATRTPDATMDTLWVVSPGSGKHSNETVLVVTHSDGGNAVEENGHLGLLALAKDAAIIEHDRTIVFILIAGHLRISAVTEHGQAATAWLDAHPEFWDGSNYTAAAGLAIEHLGAKHYTTDEHTGQYTWDGTSEPELLYATTAELAKLTRDVWNGAEIDKVKVVKPGPLVLFGESEPMYMQGIPTISLVTAPEYLLAEIDDDIVDIDVLTRQIESFRMLQLQLAGPADRGVFGNVHLPTEEDKASAWNTALQVFATPNRTI